MLIISRQLVVPDAEIDIQAIRAQGAGGQKQKGDKNAPAATELSHAIDALLGGRLNDALKSYESLVRDDPGDASYQLAVKILRQTNRGVTK